MLEEGIGAEDAPPRSPGKRGHRPRRTPAKRRAERRGRVRRPDRRRSTPTPTSAGLLESIRLHRRCASDRGRRLPSIENNLTARADLSEHLLWQLQLPTSLPRSRRSPRFIIGNLDADGYLRRERGELAPSAPACRRGLRLLARGGRARARRCRSFDPIGVAARDLRECLIIQLARSGRSTTAPRRAAGPRAGRAMLDHWELIMRRSSRRWRAAGARPRRAGAGGRADQAPRAPPGAQVRRRAHPLHRARRLRVPGRRRVRHRAQRRRAAAAADQPRLPRMLAMGHDQRQATPSSTSRTRSARRCG